MWRTLRIVLLLLGGVATVPAAAQGDVELPTDLAAMPLTLDDPPVSRPDVADACAFVYPMVMRYGHPLARCESQRTISRAGTDKG